MQSTRESGAGAPRRKRDHESKPAPFAALAATPEDAVEWASQASRGQLAFETDIDSPLRDHICDMWRTRLSGFAANDIAQYLRDQSWNTKYITGGTTVSGRTFWRICRVIFPIQRVGSRLGIRLCADALDPVVRVDDSRIVTRTWLVLSLGNRVVRQSRLTMSAVREGDRWIWSEAVDVPVPRRGWAYEKIRSGGKSGFVRLGGAWSATAC
jgi:hypothetical protein